MLPLILLGLALIPMLLEARLAARHTRALQREGAREPRDDVYGVMQVAYPACFLAMAGAAWARGVSLDAWLVPGLAVFIAAKGLKYWAIATLGRRWTFRVLVPPGSARTVTGPFRWLSHPNYVGVIGELLGMAMMAHAPITGALSIAGFGTLIAARVRIEERALGMRGPQHGVEPAPPWMTVWDLASALFVALAIWSALTGGVRYFAGGLVISLRSPLVLLYVAAALQVVRHVLWPRPSIAARIAALDAAIQARPALAAALAPFLATRLMVLVVGFAAVVTFGFPQGTTDPASSRKPLLDLPARWDAGWYGSIALDGYEWGGTFQRQQSIAFFPALPLLSRGVMIAAGADPPGLSRAAQARRVTWSAVFLSLGAFLWGLHYFVRLGQDLIGPERAAAAALLLSAYPFALYYSAAYTEALFFVGAVAACYHFRRCEWMAAAAWGLFAGLTRPNGCFLSVPLALFAWQQLREMPMPEAGSRARAAVVRLAVAAMPGIGMLIYTAYLYSLTGVWFAWARSHAAWGRSFEGIEPLSAAAEQFGRVPLIDLVAAQPYPALNALGLLFAVAMLWTTFRKLGAAWGLFVVVNLAGPLAAGGLLSVGRLTSTLFPLFLSLALLLPPRAVAPCAVAFGILQGLCAALFFTWRSMY